MRRRRGIPGNPPSRANAGKTACFPSRALPGRFQPGARRAPLRQRCRTGVLRMPKLTKRTVETAVVRASEYITRDGEIPGYGVRVYPSGRRKFVVQYRIRGRTRRVAPTRDQRWPAVASARWGRARGRAASVNRCRAVASRAGSRDVATAVRFEGGSGQPGRGGSTFGGPRWTVQAKRALAASPGRNRGAATARAPRRTRPLAEGEPMPASISCGPFRPPGPCGRGTLPPPAA